MKRIISTWIVLALMIVPSSGYGQDRVVAVSLAPAPDQVAAGLQAYRRLHFREAERHFQAAADADPAYAAAWYYLAYTVYKIAEPKRPNDPGKQRAADLFEKAYALDPGFRPTWGR